MDATREQQNRAADLVVDSDVDGAPNSVVGQRAHVQRLVHNALPREAAVAVQQDAQRPQTLLVVAVVLLRPNLQALTPSRLLG
jgi:hypothetical protein